jgi:DNA-directed RNA polymerase specialized sigma24 family protein
VPARTAHEAPTKDIGVDTTNNQPTLTEHQAQQFWLAMLPEVHQWIGIVISTMGLPSSQGQSLSARPRTSTWTPSISSTKRLLRSDAELRDDIVDHVRREFIARATANRVWAENARGLLWTIAVRVTWRLATRRARVILHTAAAVNGSDPLERVAADGPGPERSAMLAELRPRIAALPSEDRRLLSLYLEGFSHAELAQRFGISIENSRTRIFRILSEIRAMLGIAEITKGLKHDGRKLQRAWSPTRTPD